MEAQQLAWQEERKAITHRVRFPNTSVSSVRNDSLKELEQAIDEREKRLRGKQKQISYLEAKCKRESGFRRDLAFSKKFMGMQIEMFKAW